MLFTMMYHPPDLEINEPRYEKTNNVVSGQARHKPSCTSKGDDQRLEILDLESGGIVLSVWRKQRR